MTEKFHVPKRQVMAEVVLFGRPPMLLNLFLGDQAENHAGFERPSDLLNQGESFFPAADQDGKVMFIHRDAVVRISVSVDDEYGGDQPRDEELAPENATVRDVEALLEDGTVVRGTMSYVMPEGKNRLQDVLNHSDRFLTMRAGDMAFILNKSRIVRVSPMNGSKA